MLIKVEYTIVRYFNYSDRIVKKTAYHNHTFSIDLEYDLWFEKTKNEFQASLSPTYNVEIIDFKYIKFI